MAFCELEIYAKVEFTCLLHALHCIITFIRFWLREVAGTKRPNYLLQTEDGSLKNSENVQISIPEWPACSHFSEEENHNYDKQMTISSNYHRRTELFKSSFFTKCQMLYNEICCYVNNV